MEPTRQVSVVSTQAGTVDRVFVDFNQQVHEGEILATLDTGALDARLHRAMALVDAQSANRSAAEAALSDAEAALTRAAALSSSELASPKELEIAESAAWRASAALQGAKAQLRAAEADLAAAQVDLDSATLRSPMEGVVLALDVEEGQSIGALPAGSALFTIASDLTTLHLQAEIDEADVGLIASGDRATFTVEAMPDRPFEGIVRQVRLAPTVRDGVVNYIALILVGNPELLLRPGMTATAEIVVDEASSVLMAPNSALRFVPPGQPQALDPGHQLYVLDGKEPRSVPVTTGLTDGLRSEITGGDVAEGDLVITGTADK